MLLMFFCIKVLSANMLDKYAQEMDKYHRTLIQSGIMNVIVYSGFIDVNVAQDVIHKLQNMNLSGTYKEKNNFISNVNNALMKNISYSKKTLTHNYSDKGYKCILQESVFRTDIGEIRTNKNRKETSSFNGLLSNYDEANNILTISKAPPSDWYSPDLFNFAIVNPMMLDFKRFLIPNVNLKQTIEFIPDGRNGIFIKGCVNACEKLHIVIQNGFPCLSDSIYYASTSEDRILRNIYYRYYLPVANCPFEFVYPSLVIVIDAPRNNLCRVEMYDIVRHAVYKKKEDMQDEFEIQIKDNTKILTNI